MYVSDIKRPQLFPNTSTAVEDMQYPLIATYKLDGVRAIIQGGAIYSRSLKPIPNHLISETPQLRYLLSLSKEEGIVLDGELYSPELTFQEIVSVVMSHEKEVPPSLHFWCFDIPSDMPYEQRLADVHSRFTLPRIPHKTVTNPAETTAFFHQATDEGFEGLILINPQAPYKQGRITLPSKNGYKLKPYQTFDAQIIGVVQATEVDPSAPKKINELGYSETSKKQEDRIPVPRAAAFEVLYAGQPLKVTLAMTDEEKEEIWMNKEEYIGKWIEYRGLLVGAKDLPRHPVMLHFRWDKD